MRSQPGTNPRAVPVRGERAGERHRYADEEPHDLLDPAVPAGRLPGLQRQPGVPADVPAQGASGQQAAAVPEQSRDRQAVLQVAALGVPPRRDGPRR